jgi:hypothetical protein
MALTATALPEWVDFNLGEDVRDERRLEQDQLWADAVVDGRSHISHREFCVEYAAQFRLALEQYTVVELLVDGLYSFPSPLSRLSYELLHLIVVYALPGQGDLVHALVQRRQLASSLQNSYAIDPTSDVQIYLRKRPLLFYERRRGLYDVLRVLGRQEVIFHEGKLARNGRQLSMTHHRSIFDHIFDQNDGNDVVCERSLRPLLVTVFAGGRGTLLCFGQTGTGKTYTLQGALDYLCGNLLGRRFKLTFVELRGKQCRDLLSLRSEEELLSLRTDAQGEVKVCGAREIFFDPLQSVRSLEELFDQAMRRRKAEVTERNSQSSRSHAILTIDFLDNYGDNVHNTGGRSCSLKDFLSNQKSPSSNGTYGRLRIVDLAGSERNYETTVMTAAMHKESAQINLALMALKDCFRAHNSSSRLPVRASPLTRLLQDSFPGYNSNSITKTVIIATVSPSPIDLVHSLNTATHVLLMAAGRLYTPHLLANVVVPMTMDTSSNATILPKDLPVHLWSFNQISFWLSTVENGRFASLALPPGTTGQQLLQMSTQSLLELYKSSSREARGNNEGSAWTISVEENERLHGIAKALHAALRREQLFIR